MQQKQWDRQIAGGDGNVDLTRDFDLLYWANVVAWHCPQVFFLMHKQLFPWNSSAGPFTRTEKQFCLSWAVHRASHKTAEEQFVSWIAALYQWPNCAATVQQPICLPSSCKMCFCSSSCTDWCHLLCRARGRVLARFSRVSSAPACV